MSTPEIDRLYDALHAEVVSMLERAFRENGIVPDRNKKAAALEFAKRDMRRNHKFTQEEAVRLLAAGEEPLRAYVREQIWPDFMKAIAPSRPS